MKYDKGLVDATGGDTEVKCLIFIYVDMLKIIRIISIIILVDATRVTQR